MKMAPREIVLGMVTLSVALFAVSIGMAKPRIEKWKAMSVEKDALARKIEASAKLVAEKGKWAGEVEGLNKMLPSFPVGKEVDVHWLSVIEQVASNNGLKLIKRQKGDEKQVGDVYELPIECREWQANLDSLVRFLFDLQNQGAMLDVRQLLVEPKGKGVLGGRFVLYCAFTRDSSPQPPQDSSEAKK